MTDVPAGDRARAADPVGARISAAHSAAGAPGADAHSVGAILLAGGRASRMGGIDKPQLQIDGVSLLDRAIAAVRSVSAAPIVVAGPEPTDAAPPSPAPAPSAPADPGTSDRAASPSPAQPTPGLRTSDRAASSSAAQPTPLTWVREDPPFTGPVAAIVAALAAMPADSDPAWTLVLACDLPHVDAAVRQLVHDIVFLGSDIDGACLSDPSSRPQWLTGLYLTTALRRAAASIPDGGRNQSMRALLADLAIAALPDLSDSARDIDTWEDYRSFTKEDV
nr:NTP transferase domain-containing protein [Microbacterium bovistercoris]